MTVSVQEADFAVGAEIEALGAGTDNAGAVASFVGMVRGGEILAMTLEHYPGMTEKALAEIVAEARRRWALLGVRVIHRVGRLVSSSHRHDAFAACEFIMDYLKTQAPFWKREDTASGGRWVDARESDDAALARWRGA